MSSSGQTVFIIDDDASVRDALVLSLGLHGYPVLVFSDAESLLKVYRADWRGCLLIDIRMPGIDGLTLQRRLLDMGCRMPVIIMTGHGDIEAARDAFRAQAVDFLEKPIDAERLLAALDEAFAREQRGYEEEERVASYARLLATLTPREREVMELVVAGRHNREIAATLGISTRTVEVYKANLQIKLQVDNIPDLVRFSLLGERTRG
ncbi:response regulator transcription factor [Rhodocyclus purpureus]|uniref:response regulator transcription factor n=1 Tax=Rhodocyclus purpureus TaxID=1067 RepID=UPI0019131D6F|nr:response regulator [Rhodocyclus purpureus]MBK5914675.1 DNA-binding response regulator [Rhodocyclus purpureus]